MATTILVTGGAGYIGAHCCKLLAASGYRPVVYDDLSTGHRGFVRWGPLVEGDIRDRHLLTEVMAAYQPALVIHFAALALVGESISHPDRYQDVNVRGVHVLLEAMRANQCNKLVFSSTCAVYGVPETVPIGEEMPTCPINPYGASKLAAERMIKSYDAAHGIKSIRLRYFNACGADPDLEIGEDHDPETHLIPLLLQASLGRRWPVSIFGDDYPTKDGTAIRDYVHVCDLAEAHLAAARYLLSDGESHTLNLGTGEGASVADVIKAIEDITGRDVPYVQAPRRVGDPPCLVACSARAENLLRWRPMRSKLHDVIVDAWRWHQCRFESRDRTRGLRMENRPAV